MQGGGGRPVKGLLRRSGARVEVAGPGVSIRSPRGPFCPGSFVPLSPMCQAGGGQAPGPGLPGSTGLASPDAAPRSRPLRPPLSSNPRCRLGLTRAGANAEAGSQQQEHEHTPSSKGPQGHVLPQNARSYRMGKTQRLGQAPGTKDLYKTAHKATLPGGA